MAMEEKLSYQGLAHVDQWAPGRFVGLESAAGRHAANFSPAKLPINVWISSV